MSNLLVGAVVLLASMAPWHVCSGALRGADDLIDRIKNLNAISTVVSDELGSYWKDDGYPDNDNHSASHTPRKTETTIMAAFSSNAVSGSVFFTQSSSDTVGGVWKVKLDYFDMNQLSREDCSDGLNWHIHEKPAPFSGACGDTGGHHDPTVRCY